MRYVCLIYFDPKRVFDGSPESNAVLAAVGPHGEALKANGQLVFAQALALPGGWDYGLSSERRHAGAGTANRRARVAQNHEAYGSPMSAPPCHRARVWQLRRLRAAIRRRQTHPERLARARGDAAETEESRVLSRHLIKRGFRFVGPTICYAFMQSVGMVNDHVVGCFRRALARRLGQSVR